MKAVPLRAVPLHRVPPSLLFHGDQIYHRLVYLWVTLILANAGQTAISNLETTGWSSLIDIPKWPVIAWAINNLGDATLTIAVIAIIQIFFWAIHLYTHPNIDPFEINTVRVRDANLRASIFKQGTQHIAPHFHRNVFDRVKTAFHRVIIQGEGGIVLHGPTGVGKTRLAVEVLQSLVPNDILIVWPRGEFPLDEFQRFRWRNVIVLIDDLQERVGEVDRIQLGLERLRSIANRVLVIIIYRSGSHEVELLHHFEELLDPIETVITVEKIQGEEVDAFRQHVQTQTGIDWNESFFDGTPASVLLHLNRRIRQLRGSSTEMKSVLKAMALLRATGMAAFTEQRVQRVAEGVFHLAPNTWEGTRNALLAEDWLQLIANNGYWQSELRVPADAFLDICVAEAGYPAPGTTIADDFPRLVEVLRQPPVDTIALFELADTIRFNGAKNTDLNEQQIVALALAGIQREQNPIWWAAAQLRAAIAANEAGDQETAITDCEAALEELSPEQQPLDWAAVQNTLGNAYQHRNTGDIADNQEHAITAYEQSLMVYTKAAFPEKWAKTQVNLADIFAERRKGAQHENIERQLNALQNALQVYTHEHFPAQWLATKNNLGSTYLQRMTGTDSDNAQLATKQFQDILQAITRENARMQWATTQNNLGSAYREWTNGNHAEHVEQAIQCHQAALTVFTQEDYRLWWAWTQRCLAEDYTDRVHGDKAQNLEKAITYCQQAALICTREQDPMEWAVIQISLGNALDKRSPADGQDALTCYNAALEVYQLEDNASNYAITNWNISLVHERLMLQAQSQHNTIACQSHRAAALIALQHAITGYKTVGDSSRQHKAEQSLRTIQAIYCR